MTDEKTTDSAASALSAWLARLWCWITKAKPAENLPYGIAQDGCGACQCSCPNCGTDGDTTHFFSWDVVPQRRGCGKCGEAYMGIRDASANVEVQRDSGGLISGGSAGTTGSTS